MKAEKIGPSLFRISRFEFAPCTHQKSDPFFFLRFFSFVIQQIPHSLFREEGYDHREALFGVPPYGGSIAQNVYYADSDLCDPNVDTTKGYPQREKNEPWISPFILMVDRGGCTFVKKVCIVVLDCSGGL
jgi:hypothetical protein